MTKEQTRRIADLFLQRMHCYNASLDERDKETYVTMAEQIHVLKEVTGAMNISVILSIGDDKHYKSLNLDGNIYAL